MIGRNMLMTFDHPSPPNLFGRLFQYSFIHASFDLGCMSNWIERVPTLFVSCYVTNHPRWCFILNAASNSLYIQQSSSTTTNPRSSHSPSLRILMHVHTFPAIVVRWNAFEWSYALQKGGGKRMFVEEGRRVVDKS